MIGAQSIALPPRPHNSPGTAGSGDFSVWKIMYGLIWFDLV
jgi:hypothetical protein